MQISRLTFRTVPGHTHLVEEALQQLAAMVSRASGARTRILRTHYASPGAPDVVFEQEADDLAALESQIRQVAESDEFQRWSKDMSTHLSESPKRELYIVI